MAEDDLFEQGLHVRREVLGAEYVDANLEDADEFTIAFQRLVTEWVWGYAWTIRCPLATPARAAVR